jgi:hypothetical protein
MYVHRKTGVKLRGDANEARRRIEELLREASKRKPEPDDPTHEVKKCAG